VLTAASAIPEYGIGPPGRGAFTTDTLPTPDLSRNAGSATRAVTGQQKLIQAKNGPTQLAS